MAHSFVDYRDSFLRVNDQILTVISLLARESLKRTCNSLEVLSLVDAWVTSSCEAPPGMIDFQLKGFWETSDGNRELLSLIDSLNGFLKQLPSQISGKYLNGLIDSTNIYFVDIETAKIQLEVLKLRNLFESKQTNAL